MTVLKSCIRCEGDVHLKVDQYLNCLQCGSTTEVLGRIDVRSFPDTA
jgi:DNA-directed RNA polymerase subunit RPC12/RpoP